MPLTQPLPELRKNIREILIQDLPAAIKALRELLPEGSEKHSLTLSMLAQINDANKARFRNTIDEEDYARKIDTVRANLIDLLETLEEADFEAPLGASNGKKSGARTGNVLYRVPRRMPLRKPVICKVRVAIDEDALLEDIVLDADVRVKQRVEISDTMKAELLDPEGSVFQIRSLSEVTQLVRETGNTQWLFSVTPLAEGQHQLLVKVSMMEYVPNLGTYVPREVSILEMVTIVTETAVTDDDEAPLKPAGESFALSQPFVDLSQIASEQQKGPTHTGGSDKPFSPSPPMVPPVPPPAVQPQESAAPDESIADPRQEQPILIVEPRESSSRPISGRMRALSFLLLFLIVGSTATYALTPPPVRDFWFAELSGTPEAFADYIETYKDDPAYQNDPAALERVEKAYFKRARKTETIEDLRAYQEKYGEKGQYRREVAEKIRNLELREVENIRRQPTGQRIRHFLKNYPESTQLTVVAEAAATDEQVLQEVQPELDAALVQKAENATTAEEIRTLTPALKAAGSGAAVERVENIVSKKTQLQQSVRPLLREVKDAVKQRENSKRGDLGQQERGDKSPGEQTHEKPDDSKGTLTGKLEDKLNAVTNTELSLSEKTGAISVDKAILKKIADGMVFVKGGTFTMGCLDKKRDGDCQENEKPAHKVTVDDFYLSRTEVTQAQWQAVMRENPSEFKGCPLCPVENVSWHDAQDFIKKLNAQTGKKYRLPTEAEWEYAARGGAKSGNYPYAGSKEVGEVAWYGSNSGDKTHRVGQKKANELGLFDMSGNVWEWCHDWYGAYPSADQRNPTGPESGSYRVLRGGSWFYNAQYCRVPFRYFSSPEFRYNFAGFRLSSSAL